MIAHIPNTKLIRQVTLALLGVVLLVLLAACSLSPDASAPRTNSTSTPGAGAGQVTAGISQPTSPTGRSTETGTHTSRPLQVEQTTDRALSGGTDRFDYQTIDPKTGLLFISHLGSSMVHIYDTKANKVVADIPDVSGVHGVVVVSDTGKVYASATGDNQVAVIDEGKLQVVARTEGGDYPDGLAYDPRTSKVYVSDEHGTTDTIIDTNIDKRVGSVDIGGEAGNTQYDPVSGQIFVAVQTRNQLVAIDTSTDKVVGRYDLPGCDHSHGLLIDAPQHRAYVACDGNAKLLVVDLPSMKVVGEQSVGNTPDVLALDSGWHRLYVASESGVVSIFDVSGGSVNKIGEGQLDPSAHTVAVDQQTHLVYFPLENVNGKPVLRIIRYSAP